MKKSRFTEEQIAYALRLAEGEIVVVQLRQRLKSRCAGRADHAVDRLGRSKQLPHRLRR